MGSHGLLGKQNIYEQSMRCPLILSGPGIPKNQSSQAFTYVHDLYATVCDFADVKTADDISSQSLRPLMTGEVPDIHQSVFLPFQDNQRAISDGRWKLHIYPRINHRLLFDLRTNPHETRDLANDPAHRPQLERMLALMESQRKQLNDPYPLHVEKPAPKEPHYDNNQRVLDVWQPEWIRDKYFNGRNDPDHGPKK